MDEVNTLTKKCRSHSGFNSVVLKNIKRGGFKPFKRQLHKMVKHTQATRRHPPTNCLNVFNNFVRLALKGLRDLKSNDLYF